MASWAIVKITGKQYRAEVGKELVVDRLAQRQGPVTFDQVLLMVEEGAEVKIGAPTVAGARVVATVVGEEKGDKVTIVKFRAKSRYRQKAGFRPLLSRIKIETIGSQPPLVKKAPPKSSKKKQ